MERQSPQFLKKRKFLLVLPVLVIPFLTMAFWAMGGGKGKSKTAIAAKQGLNPRLPDAKLKDDKGLNKMSFYELAQKDSLRLKEAIEKERHHLNLQNDSNKYSLSMLKSLANNSANRYHQRGLTDDDEIQNPDGGPVSGSKAAEQNLMKKLQRLEEEVNKPKSEDNYDRRNPPSKSYRRQTDMSNDVDRLEKMMHVMKDSKDNNPEIKQLDTVLEKILDLQYPDRAKEKIKEKAKQDKKDVAVVKPVEQTTVMSVLGSDTKTVTGAGFYGLGSQRGFDSGGQNAIEAVVHETQILVSGAVVKLRLLNDITVNGYLIPKDNFVFGIAKLSGERLTIEINSITCNNSVFAVHLEVYDLDGLPGMHVPGSISRDVAKQSANSSVQSMDYTSLDPSLGAQVATAGVNAAKELFTKKVKLVKVTVKAGYKVLLKISN